MSKSLMCVRALYQVEEKFEIPEWIDLDNKEQVTYYEVDDHVLVITMADDKEIKIKPCGSPQPFLNPDPNELIYEEDDEAQEAREEEKKASK